MPIYSSNCCLTQIWLRILFLCTYSMECCAHLRHCYKDNIIWWYMMHCLWCIYIHEYTCVYIHMYAYTKYVYIYIYTYIIYVHIEQIWYCFINHIILLSFICKKKTGPEPGATTTMSAERLELQSLKWHATGTKWHRIHPNRRIDFSVN